MSTPGHAPIAAQAGAADPGRTKREHRAERPRRLLIGCILLWVYCAATFTIGAAVAIDAVLASSRAPGDRMSGSAPEVGVFLAIASLLTAAVVAWAFAGYRAGRVVSLILGVSWTTMIFLVIGGLPPVLPVLVVLGVPPLVLLLSPRCTRWYRARPRPLTSA